MRRITEVHSAASPAVSPFSWAENGFLLCTAQVQQISASVVGSFCQCGSAHCPVVTFTPGFSFPCKAMLVLSNLVQPMAHGLHEARMALKAA